MRKIKGRVIRKIKGRVSKEDSGNEYIEKDYKGKDGQGRY